MLPSKPPTHPIPSFSYIPGYRTPPPVPSKIAPSTSARTQAPPAQRPHPSLPLTSLRCCTHALAPLTGKAA